MSLSFLLTKPNNCSLSSIHLLVIDNTSFLPLVCIHPMIFKRYSAIHRKKCTSATFTFLSSLFKAIISNLYSSTDFITVLYILLFSLVQIFYHTSLHLFPSTFSCSTYLLPNHFFLIHFAGQYSNLNI